jgi:hypothetical protein
MSEIISVLVCEPDESLANLAEALDLRVVKVEFVPEESDSPSAAPHFAAIWKRLGWTSHAAALVLLGENSQGYLTSSIYLPLQDENGSEVAHYRFEGDARTDLEKLLRFASAASKSKQVLVLAESTYSLAGEVSQDRYQRFSVRDALTVDAFLRMHDRNELRETVIYRLVES